MIYIIDSTSTEVNRGSYCYLPYLLYSSYLFQKKEVSFYEDFSISDFVKFIEKTEIKKGDTFLVSIWSYSQIDIAHAIQTYLKYHSIEITLKFFGYYPIIDFYGFTKFIIDKKTLMLGLENQYNIFDKVKDVFLSDCDMHLVDYEGEVFPFFTSYGCLNRCKFCTASKNTDGRIFIIEEKTLRKKIDIYYRNGWHNIHFTDENFFFDAERAFAILSYMVSLGEVWNLIIMSHAKDLINFIEKYGKDILYKSGIRLFEVGLETASISLGSVEVGIMKDVSFCEQLFQKVDIPILWLTMSFFPGESISSLNKTGSFLKKYGIDPFHLYKRIRTNGTEGGLGQFFQPYHGLYDFAQLEEKGVLSPFRFIRLAPSYLPFSLLESSVDEIDLDIKKIDLFMYYLHDVYGLFSKDKSTCLTFFSLLKGKKIKSCISPDMNFSSLCNIYIMIGIAARLNILIEREK
jgi:hypothetical protein